MQPDAPQSYVIERAEQTGHLAICCPARSVQVGVRMPIAVTVRANIGLPVA
jgi:hypothetical protein